MKNLLKVTKPERNELVLSDNLIFSVNRYILVDDDPINNLICKKNIQRFHPEAEILIFRDSEEGLKFIIEDENLKKSILFLDINMPKLTGWDFLDQFSTFEERIKKNYFVFILSSSLEDYGEQFHIYPDLRGFLLKPLYQKHLININQLLLGVNQQYL